MLRNMSTCLYDDVRYPPKTEVGNLKNRDEEFGMKDLKVVFISNCNL